MSSLSVVTPNPLISLHTEQSACLFIRPAVSPHTLLHMIRRHSASHHFLSLRIPLYFPRTRYRILREKRKKDALSVILLPEARRIRPSSRNKHSRIRHPASKRKGLENLRKNKQPKEKQYTKRHKSKVRPDRLSVRFPQAKGISGFGNPAEKEGQKRKRKIKLNGVENGMIPRKKTDKKGKKNKVNGVSGFGNLMSRKEAESRNCSAIFICCRRYRLNIP